MLKFELKRLETVSGKQHFFELIIDGKSQYEQFSNEIASNPPYVSEQKTILTNMNIVANLGALPEKKFRELKGSKGVKEYEFKSKHIRAYVFHVEKTGKTVAYWGYKNNQTADIRQFRSIKKEYFKSLEDDNKKRVSRK